MGNEEDYILPGKLGPGVMAVLCLVPPTVHMAFTNVVK